MNIRGKKVTLRAIAEDDLPTLHRWANDPDIWYLLAGWHFPSSMDFMKTWFEGLKGDQKNQRFAVDAPEMGLIGTANIVDIDNVDVTMDINIYVDLSINIDVHVEIDVDVDICVRCFSVCE